MRDDREWLLDILEALEKIEKYAALGEKTPRSPIPYAHEAIPWQMRLASKTTCQ